MRSLSAVQADRTFRLDRRHIDDHDRIQLGRVKKIEKERRGETDIIMRRSLNQIWRRQGPFSHGCSIYFRIPWIVCTWPSAALALDLVLFGNVGNLQVDIGWYTLWDRQIFRFILIYPLYTKYTRSEFRLKSHSQRSPSCPLAYSMPSDSSPKTQRHRFQSMSHAE